MFPAGHLVSSGILFFAAIYMVGRGCFTAWEMVDLARGYLARRRTARAAAVAAQRVVLAERLTLAA